MSDALGVLATAPNAVWRPPMRRFRSGLTACSVNSAGALDTKSITISPPNRTRSLSASTSAPAALRRWRGIGVEDIHTDVLQDRQRCDVDRFELVVADQAGRFERERGLLPRQL